MTSSFKEQQQPSSSSSSSSPNMNPVGKKRIDAALEKNIETIVTQVRRTTTKPSQLTQNDLQLFDSTTSLDSIKNGHHSRETTPITSNTNSKYTSSSSREMTPDSINADSANEDQQQTVRNGHHYHRSMNHHQPAAATVVPPSHLPPSHHPSVLTSSATADLTSPFNSSYGPQPWPPAVYPFAHPHHGLYLPYPPPPLGSTTTPTNGLPPFYPSYDPLFIEQHYGPQGLSAFYTQQQQQARLLQEQSTMSGTPNSSPSFRESQSLTDIYNNTMSNRLNARLTNLNEQQQMMLSHLYLNQINSLPYVTLYDNSPSARTPRSNGDIGENEIHIVLDVVYLCLFDVSHVYILNLLVLLRTFLLIYVFTHLFR